MLEMATIPRITFQIYLDGIIPEEYYQSHISLKRHLKGYSYRMYTDNDNLRMLEERFPQYVELYKQSKDCEKKTIAAYAWLYCHGGIYMDPDLVLKSGNILCVGEGTEVLIFRSSYPVRCLCPYFMASIEGCEFWLKVLECVSDREQLQPEWTNEIDPESITARKNFDNIHTAQYLDQAYKRYGNGYEIVILEYELIQNRYFYSIRTFKNKNPAAWRHINWNKWIYIAGAIILILLILILIVTFFYDSWRIKKKVKEHRDRECKSSMEKSITVS
jgi:mannosyltransferase OCH1-like enzyme